MPDPGSGGGGQISRLILDDGKWPKGLVCHLRCADILQMFSVVVCRGHWKSVWRQTKPSLLSPSSPFLAAFPSSRSTPRQECKITFRAFSFFSLSHTLPVRACSFVRHCSVWTLGVLFTASGWECSIQALFPDYCFECWGNDTVQVKGPYCAKQTFRALNPLMLFLNEEHTYSFVSS